MMRYDVIAQQVGLTDNPLKGIEIGCFEGEFASEILKKFKNLYLTSIDVVPRYDRIYAKIINGDMTAEPKFKLINATSDEAIRFLYRDYDFVFIDGDHSYEQCKRDILNYMPLVKKGGIIAGHDYHVHHGVIHAVRELLGDVALGENLTWWKQKCARCNN